ncbi:GNAT family N-acetyltransferase [Pilimelia terevasa]|nr:GNAT family N-acetyltransferase [Pilimelia terevasa]
MELPADWTLTRPADADVAALTALVRASDVAALGYPDSGEDDVVEALAGTHTTPARDHWLVRDPAGAVLGWAYLDSRQGGARETAEVFVLPGRGEPAIGPLLDLLLRRAGERAAAAGRPATTLRAWAIPTEAAYLAGLREAGFAEVKRYARMRGPLDPLPAVSAPGVAVRPVREGDEADLREFQAVLDEAFRDTEDYEPESYGDWRRRIAALPRIDWDEWLVAECGGAVAGVLQSAPPGADAEGWVRNLAVRGPYRGRGVAKALLAAAFAVYAAKGRTHVGLGVDLTNPTEPYRLYRAVGMSPAYEAVAMQREVST